MTMRVLSFLVFLVVQVVFLPLAVVGVLLIAYKQMVISKRLGVSGPRFACWWAHHFKSS